MRRLCLILPLLATPVFAQPALPLPLLYTVTGVAANDTLNVRETPSADAADVGDLAPNQTVEILKLSDDGKWGMVSTGENIGWVASHFLALTPNTTGDGIALPYGLPLHMACSGAEPFWSATLTAGQSLTITNYSDNSPTPRRYPMLGMAKPVNIGPSIYGFASPPLTGVLQRTACWDGMSENRFGWEINIIKARKDGVSMLSGCCHATLK